MNSMMTGFELIKRSNEKKAIAMIVDGVVVDLATLVSESANIEFITKEHSLALEIMRHTSSHIMAQAIKELWPKTKIAIGPVIENGFYYDILSDHQITPDDFQIIEKKMREIIKNNYKIVRTLISKDQAIKMFSQDDEIFKVELVQSLDGDKVSIYTHDDKFYDLCRGPHLPNTGTASLFFKIMKVSGAYWRGDSKRDVLQRVYATSWFSNEDLVRYLHNLEEAEKRDHRKIAKDMSLFHMQDESPGCIFWHPKGWTMYNILKEYVRDCIRTDGYVEVCTPQMVDRTLWEKSGHWDKYREHMFIAESENRTLAIKPMNCPGAVQIFKQGIKSYKDLPLRMAEFGCCHRNESSGALYGMMRVRGFTQDDAHIFCTKEQINSETQKFCELLTKIYKDLGFDNFSVKFSDRPEQRTGSDEDWDLAEDYLKQATLNAGLTFSENKGEGAFYGPKLEFVLKDKLGRDWQCGTLQVDFQLPGRLGAYYISESGEKCHPVMLHRAVLGSLERFIGILLENYAGYVPMWLTPIQMAVVTITNDFDDYAEDVFSKFSKVNIRASLDLRAEKVSYKIRNHIMSKIPVIAVIGANEARDKSVTLRFSDGVQMTLLIDEAIHMMKNKCKLPKI